MDKKINYQFLNLFLADFLIHKYVKYINEQELKLQL